MNTKKPSILFVHPDLRGGGAEKVLVNLLNSMDTEKYDIHLLTYFQQGVNRNYLSPNIKQHHIFKKVFRGWSVIQKILSPKQLYKLFIKEKYDLIIAYLEGVPTRMVSGCPDKQTKLISWLHIDLKNFGIEKVYRSLDEMKHCYRKFDRVVAVSNRSLESCFEHCDLEKSKGEVIHNVVDTQLILNNGMQSLNGQTLKTDCINICSVGRLNRQKGYSRLLEVLSRIVKLHSNIHLYLIGTGELKESLQQQVSTLNLEPYVSFLGFQSNPHQFVSKCDLFVCSSFEEGYSTAVTESVILGTPVLTTKCAGMDEILDQGNTGMIVENSSEGLYNGLHALLSQPRLLSEYALKTKAKSTYYQQTDNAVKVERLLDSLLNYTPS